MPPRHLFENFPSQCSSSSHFGTQPPHPLFFLFFFITSQMSSVNIRVVPINRTHRGAPGYNEQEKKKKRHTAQGKERRWGAASSWQSDGGRGNRVQQLDGVGAGSEDCLRDAGSDLAGPCDSADLTGLGLSAAVPLALVRIAGENSIPVRAAIFSPKPTEEGN